MKKITVHQDVYEMELVLLLIELMCYFGIGNCKRVLGWPTEYSHQINVKITLGEPVQRGHEAMVLTSSVSILVDPSKSSIKFEVYFTPLNKTDLKTIFI